MDLIIHTDGASRANPGKAAAAWVIKDSAGKIQEKCGKYLGITTNNEAEYQALIEAISHAINLSAKKHEQMTSILVKSDSLLMISQLSGLWKIKDKNLQKLASKVKQLEKELSCKIKYEHIPRELNREADAEANRILDEQE